MRLLPGWLGRLFESPRYTLHFNDGGYVYNASRYRTLRARFILNDNIEYEITLPPDHWGKTNLRYLLPWQIEIDNERGKPVTRERFDLSGKRIRINIDSKSLGDTLAWIPQVDRFAQAHPDTEVYCGHFWPDLGFTDNYPNIHFIEPSTSLDDVYATFAIGFYFDDRCATMHPIDPRRVPLAQVASDILGLAYKETRPRLPDTGSTEKPDRPTVCFAMESTSGCKLWQHPGGWQAIADFLNNADYEPVLIQKGEARLDGITNLSGEAPITDRIEQLRNCEFFIGLGSGLSWLAWALGKKVVLISGFSEPFAEFQKDCYRVINSDVCHGCWNDPNFSYDRGDWDWCPHHKGTDRQFECTKEISPQQVIEEIKRVIQDLDKQTFND